MGSSKEPISLKVRYAGIVRDYGQIYLSERTIFNSFVRTHTVPLSEQIPILAVTDEWGNAVARPTSLYSSNAFDENSRFHVTAPDGNCVIGSDSHCLVNESTKSYRGAFRES